LDASLLEHVEFLAAFLGFWQNLSLLVCGIAGEAGESFKVLLREALKDIHHGKQSYLFF